ncbi:MAG: endonuclease MutS2, partial [Clostridia bacterium]|nr:endonuclease MutS2 [Clostridia bacterium]
MNASAIEKTELNKILSHVSAYASTEGGKRFVAQKTPSSVLADVKKQLQSTGEGIKLLFEYGLSKIEYFQPIGDELGRAKKGASLSLAELLNIAALLRSTRIAYASLSGIEDDEITRLKEYASRLYFDENLEKDIADKIVSETELKDTASEKLYLLRREIRSLNERIKTRLGEYLTGKEGKYLQDGIVTMRANRYVLPVRAEYKRSIKGFIHDRSASGATFFIEPEEVLEMNNELRSITLEEKEEVARIIAALSLRVGQMADDLATDIEVLTEIDACYACAQYAYKTQSVMPSVNQKGNVLIDAGRHPLIDKSKVVPVSLRLGGDMKFLLISGPNTGGKTVSLKMVGLFCMMAACGLFIPARRADIALFDEIYCDVGDSQSIEKSLSTFSSHMQNIIGILEKANGNSLVLIDELGGGTDPDEGQALARAVISALLRKGASGVVTTHYTALKEFAFEREGIENACMEFDADTLQPLYVMNIGLPGSSNALSICRRLGLPNEVLQEALDALSPDAKKFENIVRSAEESRVQAEA